MSLLTDLKKLNNIFGKNMNELSLSSILNHKEVMLDILAYINSPDPTESIRSCGQYNCVCWKYNIKNFCNTYNVCMICYNHNCIRCKEGYNKKCNKKNIN